MANTLLTIGMITREALRVLENNLRFAKFVNRDYDAKYGVEGAKIGTTLNIRKPVRYIGRTGQALAVEDATETQVALVLDTQFGVDISFTSEDLALSIDDFSQRFISPAVSTIANKIDFDGLNLYRDVYNAVGTPGTVPTALLTYLQGNQKLNEEAAPLDGMRANLLSPAMEVKIVDALKGLFQASTAIAEQYRRGRMGTAIGLEWEMDQNVRTHKTGAQGGTPLVNGAAQTGASLITDGWTASVTGLLKKGDVFTIADVNAVNPQNRQSTGALRQFVVVADVDSSGAGAATITISPSIVASGAFKTVDAAPADNAAITVLGAASTQSPTGLIFHRDAFTLAMADLPLPRGVDMADRVADKQLGVSIRIVRQYDINTDKFPCRLDVLYGWKTIYPELACRVQS